MEDLEDRLAEIGYRRTGLEPQRWRVSQIDAATAPPRAGSVCQSEDPVSSPVLRFWLDRLVDRQRPTPYRIGRATQG